MLRSYVTRKTAARLPGASNTEQVTTSPTRSSTTIGAQKL
jgi:hypothetical protein